MGLYPIVSDKACIARIKTVLQSWDKRYCRRMKAGSKQLQDYQDYLNSLCDLAPDNDELLHILKSSKLESWREDYQFYLNMKAIPQIGCMISPDTALQKKIQRSQERERETRITKTRFREAKTHLSQKTILWVWPHWRSCQTGTSYQYGGRGL